MKVAIVHDYIKEYGGAERVLEALHEIWPEADVYTSLFLPEFLGPHKSRFKDWKIITSDFQKIPFKEKLISPLRLFSKKIFRSFDLGEYDLIIVSATGAYLPNFVTKNSKSIHICYCHTPPRYLYGYPTARDWKKTIIGRIAGEFINHYLRIWDYETAQKADYFIANSNETRKRILKFYRREATVIYPPVEMADRIKNLESRIKNKNENYYLAGGRLARAKHIDLIMEAFNDLGNKLKIFGRGFAGFEYELKEKAGENIEFLGEVSDEKLKELYKNAKALVFASENEDFGIMPVEAQANGIGVIAFKQGGILESIIEGKTGLFFEELTKESIISAIKKFEKAKIGGEDCIKNSQKFTKERFKSELLEFVRNHLHARTS